MTGDTQPSVAIMRLSKAQYIELADTYREKAQQAHQEVRTWANRALLAESQLATLRAAYEPPRNPYPDIFDPARNESE